MIGWLRIGDLAQRTRPQVEPLDADRVEFGSEFLAGLAVEIGAQLRHVVEQIGYRDGGELRIERRIERSRIEQHVERAAGQLLHAGRRVAAIERAVREDPDFKVAIGLLLDELGKMLGGQRDFRGVGVGRREGQRLGADGAGRKRERGCEQGCRAG